MEESKGAVLDRGFGAGRVLHLDVSSGIAGDMILSALIDMGVPREVILDAALALPFDGFAIRVEHELRRSVRVTRFFVDVDEASQPHRHFSDIRDMIEGSTLADPVKRYAVGIFEEIARAEARVHGSTMDAVHFHEVGAVDSIVDIVGAAAAFDFIGARVTCGVVPLGRGFVNTRHGVLPVPAPATMLILEGVPAEGTEVEAELTTPTGAAIVKRVATSFGPMPRMRPERVGMGAGARSHERRPGILRAVLGEEISRDDAPATCWVIEANIDDMTGEVAAAAMEALLERGALDAWLEPIQMKKGRPALKACVLCADGDLDRLGGELMRETTTIGLRYQRVGRMELSRREHTVETRWGKVRVKVATGAGGVTNAAPEFEDCKRLAAKGGVSVKRVMAAAAGEAQRLLEEG